MTKRKAIEAAVEAGWDAYDAEEDSQLRANNRLAEVAADRAYDAGMVAGIRRAERRLRNAYSGSLTHSDVLEHPM